MQSSYYHVLVRHWDKEKYYTPGTVYSRYVTACLTPLLLQMSAILLSFYVIYYIVVFVCKFFTTSIIVLLTLYPFFSKCLLSIHCPIPFPNLRSVTLNSEAYKNQIKTSTKIFFLYKI